MRSPPRRREPRYPCRLEVHFVTAAGRLRTGVTTDVSQAGAFIESAGPPPPGSRVELRIAPPRSDDPVGGPVSGPVLVRGTIRWTRHAQTPESQRVGGFGVALDERNPDWQSLCTRVAIG